MTENGKPLIMGILNATPDSFYDGGYHFDGDALLSQSEKMIVEGADIIDVGGFSTRPNGIEISESEELRRVIPLIDAIQKNFPKTIISVDTFRAKVARESILTGASIINDISGFNFDPEIINVVALFPQTFYVLMHCSKSFETLHQIAHPNEDILPIIQHFFEEKLTLFQSKGVSKNRIILDPGFGFGKTLKQNYQLLQYLNIFANMGAVLVGISRKSMIYKVLNDTPQHALIGTSALNMIALINGARFLRVHDVKEAREVIQLYLQYKDCIE